MKNSSYKTVFIVFFAISLIGIGVSTDLTNIESIFPQDEDINVEGNLDMNNNDIRSFFSSSCSGGEVMVAVEDDGSYDCVDVSDEVSGDYVSIDGDAMEGSLDMRGNDIQDAGDIEGSTWGSLDIDQSDVDPSDVGLSDLTTGSGLSGSSYDGTSSESWSVSWGSADDLDSSGSLQDNVVGGDELESSYESGSEYDGRFVNQDGDSISGDLDMGGNDIEDVSRMNVEDGFQVPVGEDAW